MHILAIETSCDETALALLEIRGGATAPKVRVVKSLISSQIAIHAPFGGVVPNLAKREHLKNLPILYRQIFSKRQKAKGKENFVPDLIAVTVGPGLEPALWTGINFAEQIYRELKIKNSQLQLVGANHLEGHLYSFLLSQKRGMINNQLSMIELFPAIALIVSGGHTILIKMDSLVKWRMLGETRDDAVGEAFDKVARILDLLYPGGPEVEQLATRGNAEAISFPRPMLHDKSYDFSFSGLKTSVLYYSRDRKLKTNDVKLKADIAASFQAAAIDVLTAKTARAVKEFEARTILLSGGVAANSYLRNAMRVMSRKLSVNFFVAPKKFNTDNAAMIGVAGYFARLRKTRSPLRANGILSV